jgi:L-idonate 5-dehydrogenase
MRAAVLTGIQSLAVVDRPRPALPDAAVRVRVDLVGLCGSDLGYYSRGANGDFVVRGPLVLGHEIIGTVTELGADADTSISVGDRVAVHPAWPSPGIGESAVSDEYADGSASTSPHTDGGLQEFLHLHPARLRPLPQGLPARIAVLAEPLAVVLHALANLGRSIAGSDVAICGAGPIGLLSLVAAKRAGAASVTITDVRASALDLASALGADRTIDVAAASAPESGVDVVIEASGVPASLETAVHIAREGGTIVQLGMLPRDARPMTLSGLVVKELHLIGSHRFAGEIDDALDLLAGAPECAQIVTTVTALDDVTEAFAAVADPAVVGKVVVDVSGELAP